MGLFPIDTQRERGWREIKLLWQAFEFVYLKTTCKAAGSSVPRGGCDGLQNQWVPGSGGGGV